MKPPAGGAGKIIPGVLAGAYAGGMGGSGGTLPGPERPRGSIEKLASGSLRVRVFAGVDVLTGRDLYLRETIKPGKHARREARRALDKLVDQVVEDRQPKTNSSLRTLIEKHLEVALLQRRSREAQHGYAIKHIHPFLGDVPISGVNAQLLDSLYAELRRCRDHCDGGSSIRHRVDGTHPCDARCRRHVCKPLAAWTIRKIHYLISAAYESAIAWDWIAVNPTRRARKPAPPGPDPQPPTAEEAAAMLAESWRRGFGEFVWLAMTTGARRGELCALRWRDVQTSHAVQTEHDCASAGCRHTLTIRRAIAQATQGSDWWESDTKTHQRRHIALDTETVAVLAELRAQRKREATEVGVRVKGEHFVFPATPDGETPIRPSLMSHRYRRCAQALGITTMLKSLRHYSATELITAGVDIRTVAGRLGHGSGGTTTLKVYAAWVAAADQHASTVLMSRMPARPVMVPVEDRARLDPRWPHEQVAAQIQRAWRTGALVAGEPLTAKGIAAAHDVSIGTAHRVMTLLSEWGVLRLGRGRPSVVTECPDAPPAAVDLDEPVVVDAAAPPVDAVGKRPVVLELLHLGTRVHTMRARLDPDDVETAQRMLVNAVRRSGGDMARVDEYELAIRLAGQDEPYAFVVAA